MPRIAALCCCLSILAAAEGPRVERCYPVGPDLLAVRIQERTVERRAIEPVTLQAEDQRVAKGKPVPVWRDGELVREAKGFQLERGGKKLGALSPDGQWLHREVAISGAWLDTAAASRPASYALVSSDDPAYAEARAPERVSLKRKPNGYRSEAAVSVVYLHLPAALQDGASYTLRLPGLGTREAETTYVHDTRSVRSEAVHVSHLGFHPEDPAKQARISVWLGDGGAYDIGAHGPLVCELIAEADGSVAWTGEATLAVRHDQRESPRDGRNLAKTEVYVIDFSDHRQPGRYRLHVRDVGCSWPFPIAEDVWIEAVRLSLQGLLSHRSGIELPADLMGYERPRNMHPADGVRVLPIDRTKLHGEAGAVKASFEELLDAGEPLPEPLPQAWGGYMDAGDWDRRSNHLAVTCGLLELYELAPAFWQRTALVVPAAERANDLPDLLDEVRWNLDCYHRLQEDHGGVRGGIESTDHPRPAEASWQESLALGAFAPDPVSSLAFAEVAAWYARIAAEVDPTHAAELGTAARRAWDWAHSEAGQAVLDTLPDNKAKGVRGDWDLRTAETAVQLLWLTGDASYREHIDPVLRDARTSVKLEDLAFAYARLPAELADTAIQEHARNLVLDLGGRALAFQDGNAWGIATGEPNLPLMGYVGYLSVPGMISKPLARAHALTGEARFLAGVVESCAFATGANPDNRAYTTGLGPDPVAWPLHIDSLITGQEPPKGITVYGPSDPAAGFAAERWVYQWFVNDRQSTPNGKQLPMAEAYWVI